MADDRSDALKHALAMDWTDHLLDERLERRLNDYADEPQGGEVWSFKHFLRQGVVFILRADGDANAVMLTGDGRQQSGDAVAFWPSAGGGSAGYGVRIMRAGASAPIDPEIMRHLAYGKVVSFAPGQVRRGRLYTMRHERWNARTFLYQLIEPQALSALGWADPDGAEVDDGRFWRVKVLHDDLYKNKAVVAHPSWPAEVVEDAALQKMPYETPTLTPIGRTHDFSDPYAVSRAEARGELLRRCVRCGEFQTASSVVCTPRDWRGAVDKNTRSLTPGSPTATKSPTPPGLFRQSHNLGAGLGVWSLRDR